MRQLLEARSRAGSSKMRRTAGAGSGPAPPQQTPEQQPRDPAAAAITSDRPPAPARRGEDFDDAALAAMELATSFLFSVGGSATRLCTPAV